MVENHFENNTIRCKKLEFLAWCFFQSDFQPYFKTPVCGAPFSHSKHCYENDCLCNCTHFCFAYIFGSIFNCKFSFLILRLESSNAHFFLLQKTLSYIYVGLTMQKYG